MRLKEKYGRNTEIHEIKDAASLIQVTEPYDEENRLSNLTRIVGRMIDTMDLSDQEKLDLVAPYIGWEIVK